MSVNEADCRTLPFRLSHPPRKPTFENRKAQTKRLNPNLIHHPSKAKQEEKARSCFTTDFATLFRKHASPRAVPNKHAEKGKKRKKKHRAHVYYSESRVGGGAESGVQKPFPQTWKQSNKAASFVRSQTDRHGTQKQGSGITGYSVNRAAFQKQYAETGFVFSRVPYP